MKRMHLGITVTDVDTAREFYTRLLGAEPTLVRPGYVKWMLDDPLLNLSINAVGSGEEPGVNHVGLQVETIEEVQAVRRDWVEAGLDPRDQNDLVCGYQHQDKSWVFDPHELPWEVFVTHGVADDYGTNAMPDPCGSDS